MIWNVPHAVAIALFSVALTAHLVQWVFYWPRLPSDVAVHYDIEGDPSMYWPKSLLLVLWGAIVIGNALFLWFSQPDTPLLFGAATLFFLFAIMQLIIHANVRGGRISVIGVLLLAGVFAAAVISVSHK